MPAGSWHLESQALFCALSLQQVGPLPRGVAVRKPECRRQIANGASTCGQPRAGGHVRVHVCVHV